MYYVRELSDPTNPSVAGLAASNPGPIQIAPVNFDALNGLNTGLAAVNPTPKDFTGKAMVVDFTGSGEGVILASRPIEIPAGGSASRFFNEWAGWESPTNGNFTFMFIGDTAIGVAAIKTKDGLPIGSVPGVTP